MERKRKRKPIAHRVIAFVLAFAMVFTSISFSELGTKEAKAAGDWSQNNPYVIDVTDGKMSESELHVILEESFGETIEILGIAYPFQYRIANSTDTWNNTDNQDTNKIIWYDNSKYEVQKYEQTGTKKETVGIGPFKTEVDVPVYDWVLKGYFEINIVDSGVVMDVTDAEVPYNFYYDTAYSLDDTQSSELKKTIAKAVLQKLTINGTDITSIDYTKFSVKFKYTGLTGETYGELVNDLTVGGQFGGSDGTTESVTLVYTDGTTVTESSAVNITLKESRQSATIEKKDSDANINVNLDSLPTDWGKILSGYFNISVLVENEDVTPTGDVTYKVTTLDGADVTDDNFPADNDEATYKLTINVAAGSNNLAASEFSTEFTVVNPTYGVNIKTAELSGVDIKVFSDSEYQNEIEYDTKLDGGTYYVQVDPSNAYYVENVVVGEDVYESEDGKAWSDQTYRVPVTLQTGSATTAEYLISATTPERSITKKTLDADEDYIARINASTENETAETFEQRVFEAVVSSSNPNGITFADCDVSLDETELTLDALNTFVITWSETEKYPAISISAGVYVTESRTSAIIDTENMNIADVDLETAKTSAELKTLVLGAITGVTVQSDAKGLEYTVDTEKLDEAVATNQGNTVSVPVTISCAANENYTAADSVNVAVDVNIVALNPKVTVTNGINGSITYVVDEETKAFESGTYTPGTYTLTVSPDASNAWYVDAVKVNDNTINGNQNTINYTWELELQDGAALEYAVGVTPEYTIDVTYGQRTIIPNTLAVSKTKYEIGMNGFYSVYKQYEAIEAEILSDIVNANETLGYADSDKTVGVDGYVDLGLIKMDGYYSLDTGFKLFGAEVYWGNEVFSFGEESVQITLGAVGKYPAVTGTYAIDVVETRTELDITGTGTLVTYETAEQGAEAIKESALAAANLPTNPAPEAIATIGALPEDLNHKTATDVEVTISITGDENYVASSGVVKVPVILKEKASTIKAKENIAEAGVVEITNSQNTIVSSSTADTLNLSVNPEDGYYVKTVNIYETSTDTEGVVTNKTPEIAQTEVLYTDATYTSKFVIESNTAYVVEIEYAEWILDVPTELEIAVNGYTGNGYTPDYSYRTDDLKNKILTAVLGETYDASKYTVEMYVNAKTDFIDLSGYYDIESTAFATAVGLGAFDVANEQTETVRITYVEGSEMYPDAIAETVIEFTESRAQATISQKVNSITVDAMPSTYDSWYEVTDPNGKVITEGVTAVLNSTDLPDEGAENVPYTLTVTVTETENYTGATAEYTVLVTNPTYDAYLVFGDVITDGKKLATITVKDEQDNDVTSSDTVTVPSGTYYVTVTPEKGAYIDYLARVTPSNQAWNNGVYTCTINVESGATEHPKYELDAAAWEREIYIKKKIEPITFTDDTAVLLKGVYTAAVDGSNPGDIAYENVAVTVKDGDAIKKGATNTFVITWEATDKYPEVSAEADVFISENLVKADIDVSKVTVTGEGILTITKDEVDEKGELTEETKAAILDAISGIVVSDGAGALVLSVNEWPAAPTQAGNVTFEVTASVAENNRYLANTATFDVTIFGAVYDAEVTIPTVTGGTVTLASADSAVVTADVTTTYDAGTYYATLTPAENNFIEKLDVYLDGDLIKTYTYEEFDANGQVVLEIKDGRGEAINYVPKYELVATFIDPSITIKDSTVNYQGEREAELPGLIWDEIFVSDNPSGLVASAKLDLDPEVTEQKVNELTVYYLAREAATYHETFTVNLPVVGNQTFEVDVPVGDQWLEISQEVPVGAGMPTQDDIQAMVDDLLDKYTVTELLSMGTDALKELVKTEMEGVYEEYYRFYNAHTFGMTLGTTETVKVVYNSKRFGTVESDEAVVTLDDTRPATEIKLNAGVEMTYGFTEAELTEALLEGVYANGEKIDGAKIQYITSVVGLNASEEAYTIKVLYDGGKEYKHSTAETTIIVNKASVDVQVDNRLMKWEEGLIYDLPVVTDPSGVDTINFIVGLNVENINIDENQIKGIMGEVQLMIPDELQDILAGVGIADGVSMTVSELQDALLLAAEALGWMNTENEAVNVLINMLESLPTETADITIRVGGEMPTDIGVYLVGAVSADGNYETNAGVGFVVITPDGKKVDLGWKMEDDNHIITRTLLTNGTFDTDATVTKVYEGDAAEAEEQIVEVFLGLDVDGNIILETDQTKLNVGAYTEVAMVVNWGNEMYYSEPIARAFVVAAESLDIKFVDETGEENKERFFTFDNTAKEMDDVIVSYKNGDEIGAAIYNSLTGEAAEEHANGELKIYYVGAQTNANPYASTEPPVHAGAYTVTAVYTLRDADGLISHAGVEIGAMVIEPAESDTTVANGYYKYEKGTSHVVTDLVTAASAVEGLTPDTTVISAGITTDGTFSYNAFEAVVGKVNVDMPTWLDELFVKYNLFEAGYTEEGISAATFLVYLEKAEDILSELNINLDTLTQLKDTVAQMPDNTTLTFADDAAYENVGAYLVVGVVTDSDHYPSVGAGLMVIYPDATEVDLAWNEDDWNNNNLFTWNVFQKMDVDASAYNKDTAVKNAEASAMVDNFFLGVTDDGEILLTSDKEALDVGAYTQFAYLLDLDSVMYYAKPIARPFVIIPNIADIIFVDENGAENADRHFVYDCNPHAMKAVVTIDGEVVAQTGDDGLTVTYTGVQSNGKIYNSTEAPTHTGAYTVTAIYTMNDDQGRRVNVGMEVGAMVIEPAASTMDVANVAHEFDNQPYDTASMITATSAANDPDLDTTVITASLATDGNFSEEGLGAIEGAVNIDLPDYVDAIAKQVKALEAGYTGDGLNAEAFINILKGYEEELGKLNITTEIYNGLMNILEQLPADTAVTFKEQADVAPNAIGAYLVIGMVTDTNHYPSMDAGVLVIYPNAQEAELDWRYVDDNNIYTLDALDVLDLGADAFLAGEKAEELSEVVETLYIGVDTENWEITLTDSQADLTTGVYTEMAYLLVIDGNTYYAEPISRPITVVPNVYNVNFHDGTQINNDRLFTFDNTAKSMGDVVLTDLDGNVIDPADGTLTVTYVGKDGTPGIYYSSEAPVHAGAYTVVATYVGRDADNDLAVGVGIGAMVIQPADATVGVDSQVVIEGSDYTIGVTATAADYVVNDTPKTLTILAGVDMDEYAEKGTFALDGVVNVDFPTAVDNVLKEVVPEWYEHGIGTDAFFARYDEVVAAVEAAGYDTTMFAELKSVLTELNAANLTFGETEEAKPTATGVYAILSMVFDPDYKSAVDTALLVIAPNATVADLEFKMDIPGVANIIPYEWVEKIDFGAQVENIVSTNPDVTADDVVVKDVIFGLTTDFEIFIGSSEDKPTELGVYDQVAYAEADTDFALVLPITRAFTVVKSTANVEFYDGEKYEEPTPNWLRQFVYDGEPQDMPVRMTYLGGEVVKDAEGNIITPNVWYLGMENDIVVYSSDVAPTDVGAYQAIGYYFDEESNIYTVGLGAMVITEREVTITVDDQSMVVNGTMPELTYKVDNEAAADPLKVTVTTEADGTVVGEFPITANVAENPNYKVIEVVDSTLTVSERPLPIPEAIENQKYEGKAIEPTLEIKDGEATLTLGTDYEIVGYENNVNVGTAKVTVKGIGNYEGTQTVEFAIVKAPLKLTVTDKTKVYGDNDPELTFIVDGLLGEDTESALNVTLSREKGENVGVYTITAEADAANYDITVVEGTLTITKALLTVTVTDKTITYGDAEPTLTGRVSGLKYNDVVEVGYNCEYDNKVGTYEIDADVTVSDNYEVKVVKGTLTINPKAITVTAENATKVYGEADPAFTYKAPGLVGNDTLDVTFTRAEGENVGTYAITAAVADNANYAVTVVNGAELTIKKKAVTVTADAKSKVFGAADPVLTATVEGTVGNDSLNYTVARATGENAGTYAITVTAGDNPNYEVTATPGTFTITKAANAWTSELAITGWTYGEEANAPTAAPAFGEAAYSYTGTTAAGDAYRSATAPTEAGTYTVTATVEGTNNYAGLTATKDFAVAKKAVTVTADAKSKVYGAADPVLTATVEGTVGNDSLNYTVARESGENAGTYAITVTAGDNPNYEVTATAGTFTITKAANAWTSELAITGWTYGEAANAPTAAPAFGEAAYSYTGTTAAGDAYSGTTAPTEAGTYTVTATVEGTDNYAGLTATKDFTVAKKAVTVTADAKSKVYGAADPVLTATVEGTVGNDSLNYTVARESGENAGTYAITITAGDNPNYEVTATAGTLTITKTANAWTSELAITGWTYGEEANAPTAAPAFGEAAYSYTGTTAAGDAYRSATAPTEAGTYTVTATVEGTNNYAGLTATKDFTIAPKAISTATAVDIADQIYTGSAITPSAVVKDGDKTLVEGTDYTVSYTNNTKPGEATITITGKGNYTGTKDVTFTIAKTIEQVIAELGLVDIEATGKGANSMYIRGFTVGDTAESLKAKLEAIEGATLKSFVNEANATKVATGMEFTLTINGVDYHRVMVVMGDTNGDGNIWATDYTLIKNQIMTERVLLVDEYRIAADINRDDNIYATDYTAIKNYIMNGVEIDQSGAILQ